MTIFRNKKTDTQVDTSGTTSSKAFAKPKIMLLDIASPAASDLRNWFENVSDSTLGRPYRVKKGTGFLPVIQNIELTDYEEQEIVVADFTLRELGNGSVGDPHRPDGEMDLWAKCDLGYIDNRVRTVSQAQPAFNRILKAGGVFVAFAAPAAEHELKVARGFGGHFTQERSVDWNIWGLVEDLRDIHVSDQAGQEMFITDMNSPLTKLLAQYLPGGRFECTLAGKYNNHNGWDTLAVNKFGDPVALSSCLGSKGTVIVVPQIADKTGFLRDLILNVLPDLSPHLFPEIEKGKWTHRPEYELPRINELQAAQASIRQEADRRVAALSDEIELEKTEKGWLHDLLTGTGDVLVSAVKNALAAFGFDKVVDVDEERDREGKTRREDLQIHDISPLLVVDIKGIGGYPSDDDATQADKHVFILAKELKRVDVKGLSIINHQRHLPPLDRENRMPFRQELLDVTTGTDLGLMTAFDLYRLAVNAPRLGWNGTDIRPVFYRTGRIDVVPEHYQYIGTVAKEMTGKFGVVIERNVIHVGDSVAVEGPIFFEEEVVESIQVDGNARLEAKQGDRAGFLWTNARFTPKSGMRVFAIPKKAGS